jgi:hypothetical protein
MSGVTRVICSAGLRRDPRRGLLGRFHVVTLIAAATAALAVPAPALGVRSWQAPVTLFGPSPYTPRADLAVEPNGTAVVVGEGGGSLGQEIGATFRPADGGFGTARPIGRGSDPHVAIDATGDAVAVWVDGSSRIQAALRPGGGSFAAPQTVSAAGQTAGEPRVAIDSAGDALAVWQRGVYDYHSGFCQSHIEAAWRPAGGSFGPPQTISGGVASAVHPEVAVNAEGTAVAVWESSDVPSCYGDYVQAASSAAGGSFGAAQRLSPSGQFANEAQVAVDPLGDAIAVWSRFDGTHTRLDAAIEPAGGSFGPAQTISAVGEDVAGPRVATDGQGDATVVWWSIDQAIKSAVRPAGGGFGPPEAIPGGSSGSDVNLPQLAVNAAGDAVALWSQGVFGSTVQAAVRPAGGSFGAAQAISGSSGSVGFYRVGIDSQANALAVWTRTEGNCSFVQAAAYGTSLGTPSPTPGCPPVAAPPPVAGAASPPPTLTRLRLRPNRFRAATRGGSVASRVGTRVGYTLSEPAVVRFGIDRVKPGRRVRGRCRRATARNRTRPRCTRYVRLRGSFTHRGHTGRNGFTFRGRLRHRRLRPGSYRLSARATDFAGRRSQVKRRRFWIMAR